jgi:MYXO-CTERM domain-containing protein
LSAIALLLGLAALSPAWAAPARAQGPAVPLLSVPPVDVQARLAEDAAQPPGRPYRFAEPKLVDLSPATAGWWDSLPDGRRRWRLRVGAAGAASLNLAFTEADLPKGASLTLSSADGSWRSKPITRARTAEGQLWTPIVPGDELLVELVLPAAQVPALKLRLTQVNVGYRGFGLRAAELPAPPAGACNVDTVCPEGDEWEDEIHASAVYAYEGYLACSGAMINNTAQDGTPYFLTANHCGVSTRNDDSVVVYWNFESPTCGRLGGGSLDEYTEGATYLAGWSTSDFTLIELDSIPDPDFEVSYAGWDRSGDDATSAVGIHHPNTDEKAISFEEDGTTRTEDYSDRTSSSGSHVRVGDWDLGTTEGGSSGSPLFNQDHRIIGQLTGGYAACGNNESDWYGSFALNWDGSGRSGGRVSDYLDAAGTGAEVVDTWSPWSTGLDISPLSAIVIEGPAGGPFTGGATLSVRNRGTTPLSYTVSAADPYLSFSVTSASLSAGEVDSLTVSAGAGAAALSEGVYATTLFITNTTDGAGNAEIPVQVLVGERQLQVGWDMSADPGWTADGDWAWGVPAGRGGSTGASDPDRGHTGAAVYGYNLAGDYDSNLRATHLTTAPIDLSGRVGTQLRFWRWLGVEEGEYDNASLSISTDGRTWATLWENTGAVDDGGWELQEIDLSAYADDQASVQLRWTMGATDRDVEYCGWNIDDVEIWAIGEPTGAETGSGGDDGTTDGTDGTDGTTDGTDGSTDGTDGTDGTVDSGGDGADGADDAADGAEPDDGLATDSGGVDGVTDGDGKVSGCACSGAPAPRGGLLALGLGLLGLVGLRRRR